MRTHHGNLYCSLPGCLRAHHGLFTARAFESPASFHILVLAKSHWTVQWFIQSNQKKRLSPLLICINVTSPDQLPNQAMLSNPEIFCLISQHELKQLCRIRQPNPKLLHANLIFSSGIFSFCTFIYYNILMIFTRFKKLLIWRKDFWTCNFFP